ncbi:hypothetical protein Landi51_05593 [Colletotrichum acutatum]
MESNPSKDVRGSGFLDSLPSRYMEDQGRNLHPIYRDPILRNPSLATVTASSIDDSNETLKSAQNLQALKGLASNKTQHFQQVMDEFVKQQTDSGKPDLFRRMKDHFGRQEAEDPAPRDQSFNIRGTHSWDEVVKQIQEAKTSYESKAAGKSGMATKAGRFISDHAKYVDPWVALIPSSDYSSVVSGGLKFVLGAANAQANIRTKIIGAIERLPDDLETTRECLARFDQALNQYYWEALQMKALNLYVGILTAIEAMLAWLDQHAFKKMLKSLMLQDNYGLKVAEYVENIKKYSVDLRQFASECAEFAVVQTFKTAKEIKPFVEEAFVNSVRNFEQGRRTEGTVQSMTAAVVAHGSTLALLSDENNALRSIALESDWKLANLEREFANFRAVQGAILEGQQQMMLLSQQQAQQMSSSQQAFLRWPQQAPQQTQLTRQHLQARLDVSIQRIEWSLESVRSIGRVEGISGSDLVKKLTQIRKFRAWMQSNQSQVLLLRIYEPGKLITPLSSVCSSLLASLKDLEPTVTLHYFCGILRKDSEQGRFHLLRSLIVQLLEKFPAEQAFAMDVDYARQSEWGFNVLRQLFETALLSMPGAVIFCVIDGCSRCTDEDELQDTMHYLLWVCQEQSPVVKLKLLLASPVPQHISQRIPGEMVVFLPTVTRQERSGLTYGLQPTTPVRRQFDRAQSGSPPAVFFCNEDDR